MKRFNHEVLSFDANGKKEYKAMQDKLRDWGEAGFEIVSVISTSMNGSYFTVFLKREMIVDTQDTVQNND